MQYRNPNFRHPMRIDHNEVVMVFKTNFCCYTEKRDTFKVLLVYHEDINAVCKVRAELSKVAR